ncbi:TetR/AcrR family transcriptional regulator [Anoxynatronum buryatiense]|uniref:Transcriptional regulator, TetR family n=1 Tax=Anoxynatronum buryatiense TaxID=489973 RepID=A0AA45WZF6_9CLOT|nr:TetR/AcrR family transcriptional regulator [Anoxynatronum buryatiense]SMP72156.1 transcriptional regulator, TetR family [Anoxynatronum buryatiense]
MSGTDARNNIIKVVVAMLAEGKDVEKITVRQVAERANVGMGLINYHFNSKNALLGIAVADYMATMAADFATPGEYSGSEPSEKLKIMLTKLYSFAEQHEKLIKFTITQNLLDGEMQTPLFIVPLLGEIFADRLDPIQLRIIALQILLPIQVASINPSKFLLYSGIDLRDEQQRNHYIGTLVDNLLKPQTKLKDNVS